MQLPSVTWGGKHEGYAVGLGRGAGTRCGWGPGRRGGLCSPGVDLNHALRVQIHIHLPHRIIKKADQRVSHVARVAGCQRVAVPVISQLVRVVASTGAQTRTAVRGRDPRGRAPPTSFPTPFFSFSSSCPPRRGLGGWAKRESAEPPPTHTRTHTHTQNSAHSHVRVMQATSSMPCCATGSANTSILASPGNLAENGCEGRLDCR